MRAAAAAELLLAGSGNFFLHFMLSFVTPCHCQVSAD